MRASAGEVTRFIARFGDFYGPYVWHCHILEHEDNEMMRYPRAEFDAGRTTNEGAGLPGALVGLSSVPGGYILAVKPGLAALYTPRRRKPASPLSFLVGHLGLEPRTVRLRVGCSTN